MPLRSTRLAGWHLDIDTVEASSNERRANITSTINGHVSAFEGLISMKPAMQQFLQKTRPNTWCWWVFGSLPAEFAVVSGASENIWPADSILSCQHKVEHTVQRLPRLP